MNDVKQKSAWWIELDEILSSSGLRVTFDRFRDSTKGCGPHCLAWERGTGSDWCENHKAAMQRGEYKPVLGQRE
jgi:hypothetical protein